MKIQMLTVLVLSVLLIGCNLESESHRRVRLIGEFLIAASKLDTTRVFDLTDTVEDFKGHSKESFLGLINYLHYHIRKGDIDTFKKMMHEHEVPTYEKEYAIRFHSAATDSMADSSFEIDFTFPIYKDNLKIPSVDLKKPLFKIGPIIAYPHNGN